MAFKESGSTGDNQKGGIKMNWDRLEDYGCPMCGDDLKHFEHIDLWKCICGFKISNNRLVEIISSIDEQDYNSGFRYGGYTDESPF